jgi:hypothetical protein
MPALGKKLQSNWQVAGAEKENRAEEVEKTVKKMVSFTELPRPSFSVEKQRPIKSKKLVKLLSWDENGINKNKRRNLKIGDLRGDGSKRRSLKNLYQLANNFKR